MRITGWDIKGFGKFKQYKATPGPGFNMIYAPNESGKSTLQAFIRAMLYGLKGGRKAKDGMLPPLKQYQPWHGEAYAGVLEYTLASGDSYRVGRNFEKGTVNIYDSGANPINALFPQDKGSGPKFAEEHLGLDEATFERSAFIGQMQCAVDEAGRRTLIEKIANLNTTGSEDQSVSCAIQALETTLLERVGTGRSTTRPLDKVNMRIQELEKKLQELTIKRDCYLDTFKELHDKKRLLAHYLEEREDKLAQESRAHSRKLQSLKSELEALSQELEEKGKEFQLIQQELQRAESYSHLSTEGISQATLLFHDIQRTKQELIKADISLEELKAERNSLEASLDNEEAFIRKTREIEIALRNSPTDAPVNEKASKITRVLAGLTGVAAVASLVLWFFVKNPMLPMAALFGMALTGLLWWVGKRAEKTGGPSVTPHTQALNRALSMGGFTSLAEYLEYKDTQQKERHAVEGIQLKILEARRRYEELEALAASLEEQWKNLTGAWPKALEEDREALLEKWRTALDSRTQLALKKKAILDGMAYLTDKRRVLVREMAGLLGKPGLTYEDCLAALEQINTASEHEESFKEVSPEEIKQLEQTINDLKLEIATLTTRLEQVPQEGEITRVIEELGALEEKKQQLERVGAGLELAKEILLETAKQVQKDYIPALNEEMGRFLSQLTSGRYAKVSTNDALQVILAAPETEELIPVERLSVGTVDQVYLAMRLAVVRLLEKRGEPLPLFLDEPFSQYDEDRILNGFKLLKELAGERQIFFFTCRERELELAEKVMGSQWVKLELQ